MITIHKSGQYKLVETKRNTKILHLDADTYAWIETPKFGELLVFSHVAHKSDCILSTGHYTLYNVDDEPKLSDQRHLELEVGNRKWQGYLLPTGLPDARKKRSRIIPTLEVISGNRRYAHQKAVGRYMAFATPS